MRNFNRGGFSGQGGRRDSGRPKMHEAQCDECGDYCEVPFKPRGDKPVLCSDCYGHSRNNRNERNDRGGRDNRGGGRDFNRSGRRQDFNDRRMFEAVCDECDKTCEVPFRPTAGKPIFCDDCFSKNGNNKKGGDSGKSSKQLEELNKKLDKIIDLLSSIAGVKTSKKEKTIELLCKEEKPKETGKKFTKKKEVGKKVENKPTAKKTEKKKPAKKKATAKKTTGKKKI